MKTWPFFFLLAFFSACSGPEVVTGEEGPIAFQGAGHEQFFLPELPHWANGSLSGRCQRPVSVRYLDYVALEKVHALEYRMRVELQAQFHRKWRERYYGKTTLLLTPREEAAQFMETLGQVKGGLHDLRFPAGAPFQLVWFDSLRGQARFPAWLTALADEGAPVVLLSLCEDDAGLAQWLADAGLDGLGAFTLGAEAMNPQRMDGTSMAGPVMPLEVFFPVGASTLWIGGGYAPAAEFPAGYNVKTVEEKHVRNGQEKVGP